MKTRHVSILAVAAFGFVLILVGTGTVAAEVGIEYIAHACFVIESPEGTRVVIDPYNTQRWLGYGFPQDIEANAVLVTHPHYDHDASYYWGDAVPVFREAGSFSIGDVGLQGVLGVMPILMGRTSNRKTPSGSWRPEASASCTSVTTVHLPKRT